jgi:hypothetical protein
MKNWNLDGECKNCLEWEDENGESQVPVVGILLQLNNPQLRTFFRSRVRFSPKVEEKQCQYSPIVDERHNDQFSPVIDEKQWPILSLVDEKQWPILFYRIFEEKQWSVHSCIRWETMTEEEKHIDKWLNRGTR